MSLLLSSPCTFGLLILHQLHLLVKKLRFLLNNDAHQHSRMHAAVQTSFTTWNRSSFHLSVFRNESKHYSDVQTKRTQGSWCAYYGKRNGTSVTMAAHQIPCATAVLPERASCTWGLGQGEPAAASSAPAPHPCRGPPGACRRGAPIRSDAGG